MLIDGFVVVKDTETTKIYTYGHTLSLHDALPISGRSRTSTSVRASGSTSTRSTGGSTPTWSTPSTDGERQRRGRGPRCRASGRPPAPDRAGDRKSTRLNSSH